jgi:hypothetical protein
MASSAIDLVRDHFASLGTKRIEVPEWKITVFSAPVTLSEKSRLYKKSQASEMELLVDIIIMKATDENGEKLFTIDNKITFLNKADSNVIGRLANAILSEDAPKVDELKN